MKINKTNILNLRKIVEKNRGIHAELLVQELLINPDYLKRFQMKAIACSMTLKYDIRII